MNLQEAPRQDNWNLSSVKVKRAGDCVEFKSKYMIMDGNESYEIPKDGKYPIVPHGDLIDALQGLKNRLASDYGYTLFDAIVKSDKFQASPEQLKHSQILLQEFMKKIHVVGYAYSGKNRKAIKVIGEFEGKAIVSAILSFDNSDYGDSLEEACSRIDTEVYEYLFLGKKAQYDLMFGSDEVFEDE